MTGWEIRIEGIVQGVGFRPTVYRLAHEMGIRGEVSNGAQGVRIRMDGSAETAQQFLASILANAPARARITHQLICPTEIPFFEGFDIVESLADGPTSLLLPPDYGLCMNCRQELFNPANHRYGYNFITCTECGPRYSIIQGLPYDRPLTTMRQFEMCAACEQEYHDPLDRRHFSQTNSCPDCGIKLQLWNEEARWEDGVNAQATDLISRVSILWKTGQIVAIKGIGGYLLTCDARNVEAIRTLRERKHRPDKPLALMYPGLDSLVSFGLTQFEMDALQHAEAPIVLVPKPQGQIAAGIADELDRVGVMLPYAPLFATLLAEFAGPIVATSGNLHQAPIVHSDTHAPELLAFADWVLDHDRPIHMPQDDSVVAFSPKHQQRIILRRSRGLAPTYFLGKHPWPEARLFAAGADMKASVGFLHQGNAYLSQYLGALGSLDSQERYELVRDQLANVLQVDPELVLHDLHPNYHSSHMARDFAIESNLPRKEVQHHEAHFAAVLGENDLFHQADPVLGLIWDGTGFGHDGQIWGGEWLHYRQGHIKRLGHLGYFPVLGGDKMAREPRLSALALLPENETVQDFFSPVEQQLYTRWRQRSETVQTSSMGRLFDAVGALLGFGTHQSFEGGVAMKLEAAARCYLQRYPAPPFIPFWEAGLKADPASLMQKLADRQTAGAPKGQLAAVFHLSLVEWAAQGATETGISKVACSGGVFQNALLVDLLIDRMGDSHQLYFHRQLSPNDENIAFGQIMHHLFCSTTQSHPQPLAYVSSHSRKNTKH